MLSVRLDPQTEQALDRTAAAQGLTKSEFLRNLIDEHLKEESRRATPWQLGSERFGRVGSGRGDLSTTRKSKLKEKLRGKTGRH
ncbi:MAG: ribbon-helix-helix protein, CopG family [Verrucomicrobiota bacterium]